MKTLVIVAMTTLLGLLTGCGQSSGPSPSTSAPTSVAAPTEPAIEEAAPVVADPVAGTPTPPAE